MVAITSPSNIPDIHNVLHSQGFQPIGMKTLADSMSSLTLAKDYFASWNNPDDVLHDPQELIDVGVDPEFFSDTAQQLDDAQGGLLSLQTHMVGIQGADSGKAGSMGSANLVKNMSFSSMEKTRQETLGIAPTNPCDAISGLFGSVTGALEPIVTTVFDAVALIIEKIGEGITAVVAAIASVIGPAVAAIANAVNEITETIARELSELSKIVAETLKFAQTLALPNLFQDPCLKQVINIVAPQELKSALSFTEGFNS